MIARMKDRREERTAGRGVEKTLHERYHHHEAEESVYNRGNAGEQVNGAPDNAPETFGKELGDEDGGEKCRERR